MKFISAFARPSRIVAAAVLVLGAAAASAQVIPQVVPLGGGCGVPKPRINSTFPLLSAASSGSLPARRATSKPFASRPRARPAR